MEHPQGAGRHRVEQRPLVAGSVRPPRILGDVDLKERQDGILPELVEEPVVQGAGQVLRRREYGYPNLDVETVSTA